MKNNSNLIINGSFDTYSSGSITINENATLELGSGYINTNSQIDCFNHISIGQHVVIGPNVVIRDSDNHMIVGSSKSETLPIYIEDNVWIGMNVTILKGVTIGKGSVVAAGAVVADNIPTNSLAAGVPAKIKKRNIEWI